jgi:hypothetical protein
LPTGPATEEFTEGPFVVAISQAIDASQRLHTAIDSHARLCGAHAEGHADPQALTIPLGARGNPP